MKLNEYELDALTEIINIGAGRAANSLSEITGSRIELKVPELKISEPSELENDSAALDAKFGTTVFQHFRGDISGRALLAFPKSNACQLASIVGDIDICDSEMDEELCGVMEEIGNIVLNGVMGSLANAFDCGLEYTLPELCQEQSLSVSTFGGNTVGGQSVAVIADTSFNVASKNISGSLLLLFEMGNLGSLLAALAESVEA